MRYKRLRYFVDNAVTFNGTRLGFENKRSCGNSGSGDGTYFGSI